MMDRTKNHAARLAICCALALIPIACGGPTLGTVTGKVSFAGQPLTGGTIILYCANGQSLGCDIQPDGSFHAEKVPLGEAIVVVQPPPEPDEDARRMSIKKMEGKAPLPPRKQVFPSKYSDMSTTDQKIMVKAGENKCELQLTP